MQVEGADAVMVQELQVGGHLYLQILKERLQTLLYIVKANILKQARSGKKFVMSLVRFICNYSVYTTTPTNHIQFIHCKYNVYNTLNIIKLSIY